MTDDEVQRLREREQDLSGRHQAISKRIGELRSKKGQLDDMRIDLEMAAKMDTSWKDRLVNLRQSVKQETGEDEMPGTQLNTLFEGIDNMHSDLMGQQFPEWEYDDFTDVEDAAAQEYSIDSNTE